jgi:hypothetical protein
MPVVVKADVALYPFGIDSFGTDGIVSDSNLLAQLIQQPTIKVVLIIMVLSGDKSMWGKFGGTPTL